MTTTQPSLADSQTTTAPIVRLCDWDAYSAALPLRFCLILNLQETLPNQPTWGVAAPVVRGIAASVRRLTGEARAEQVARALEALAEKAEQRPANDRDLLTVSHADRYTLLEWVDRCRARSLLLGRLDESLINIANGRWAKVGDARDALALLADADLLLPGIDSALRPILTPYAALPAEEDQ